MSTYAADKEYEVTIPCQSAHIKGNLYIPKDSQGIVLFVHGSGSSRLSQRNQHVAKILNKAGLATLLFDLLTPEEENIDMRTREFRFDIGFLAARLIETTDWVLKQPGMHQLSIGYFGASTGGGAAIVAAAKKPGTVKAVVSRGGRPDLGGEFLQALQAPTLLIVGGNDEVVIEMNQTAMAQMHCTVDLKIVPGATHLFEEPGTLDEVALLAKAWFVQYLGNNRSTFDQP